MNPYSIEEASKREYIVPYVKASLELLNSKWRGEDTVKITKEEYLLIENYLLLAIEKLKEQ